MMESLRVGLVVALVGGGVFFTFVSAVGVIRLPDIYSRSHTASQTDTLGAGFAFAAVALTIGWDTTTIKTVLLLAFIFVTNPTAAHAIARAAYEEGIEPWTIETDDAELAADGGGRGDGQPPGTVGELPEENGKLPEENGESSEEKREGNA